MTQDELRRLETGQHLIAKIDKLKKDRTELIVLRSDIKNQRAKAQISAVTQNDECYYRTLQCTIDPDVAIKVIDDQVARVEEQIEKLQKQFEDL